MSNGLGVQVDGNHYTNMKMQPVELAYKLYGTPCFCKLAKYLTRDKGDKLTNLKKALHCIQLEKDLTQYAIAYLDKLDGLISTGRAIDIIKQFTEEDTYRAALFHMWLGNYESAVLSLENIIAEYEGTV